MALNYKQMVRIWRRHGGLYSLQRDGVKFAALHLPSSIFVPAPRLERPTTRAILHDMVSAARLLHGTKLVTRQEAHERRGRDHPLHRPAAETVVDRKKLFGE